MYIKPEFVNQYFYHIYNRGVDKGRIFKDIYDYQRLLDTFSYYLQKKPAVRFSELGKIERQKVLRKNPENPIVRIHAFCLMPNHYHLLVEQLIDGGIIDFVRLAIDSYTRYFNTRHDRVGPLFQGKFKAVLIRSDEQLLHLSRYFHLNSFVSGIVKDPGKYPWSSYKQYLDETTNRLCSPAKIIEIIGSPEQYMVFVNDYKDYIQSLEIIQKTILD